MNQRRLKSKWIGNNTAQVCNKETQNGDLHMGQIGWGSAVAMSGISDRVSRTQIGIGIAMDNNFELKLG